MENIHQLEHFYQTKYDKEKIVNAINNINNRVDFELALNKQLTIRDFLFTYLSYKTSWNDFLYIWKNFSSEPSAKFLLNTSYEVILDKFEKKNDVALAIRFFITNNQKQIKQE
jgi:hypothetical protein